LCTVAVFRHTRLTIVDPSAVLVDLSSYSLAVPVIPFRLQALGYGDIGGKTGWLVSAYAGGLIVSSPVVAVVGAKYKNRQIPLFLGLLFMAGAVVLFMEAESYGTSRVVLTRGRRSLY
jgi:MFS family permease